MSQAAKDLICVTGASGYIAGHIIEQLLAKGHRVRGVVRDLQNKEKLAFLHKFPQQPGQLELVQADLQENKYAEILQGCTGLIHTATPYVHSAPDPLKDIVQPAVDGTVNAITGALKAGVKRVVITSSGGAIFHFPVAPNYVFTDKDWNNWSSLENNPYFYSKVLAERAAWDLYEKHKADGLELVVINALFVVGPTHSPILNTSLKIIKSYLLGDAESIIPGRVGIVDVRDVAAAHIIGVEHRDAPGKRLICCSETHSWKELALKLAEKFPQYPNIKEKAQALPDPEYFSMDTNPLKELGMPAYRNFDTMIQDTVDAFIKVGAVSAPK